MGPLQAGGLLDRRYRLLDRIGAGGMSVIWRARDEVLDRVVAVKVLAASLAADGRFRDMVREEARAAAQLIHPHVTSVHDYGETVAPDGSITAFVVMELLVGEELETQLSQGPLPWPEAVEICGQVAAALAAAHELGIVHRDVTPSNIMLTAAGAKVLDFGIATHVGAPDEDADGETFGTPAYVAPERLDGTPAQPATDVYALGVLLYETVSGRLPFPAETWDDLTEALRAAAPPPLWDVPGLPAAVAEVCLRCLARDPADRPTAQQVGRALREHVPADPRAAGALPARALPAVTVPAGAGGGSAPARVGGDRSVGTLLLVGGLAAALVVSVLLGLRPEHGQRTTPQVQPPAPAYATSAPASARSEGSGEAGSAPTSAGQPPRSGPGSAGPGGGTPSPPGRTSRPGGTTPNPGGGAPDPGGAASPTTGTQVPTLSEAFAVLNQTVDAGRNSGAIRDDVAVDLQNLAAALRSALIDGAADGSNRLADFRHKVDTRATEGAITPRYADLLNSALDRLSLAAG